MAITSTAWQARFEKVLHEYPTADTINRNWESLLTLATEPKEIASWRDFQRWAGGLEGKWCFRGHADKDWYLLSSFDRQVRKQRTYKVGQVTTTTNVPLNPRLNESEMLVDFQRGAHHYYPSSWLPDIGSRIDWLALMQHHGAPTRLLDWTISPYVGLWFALEDGNFTTDSCIWGIDLEWLEERSVEILKKHHPAYPHDADFHGVCKYFNEIIFAGGNPQVIFSAEPLQVNERMASQQGILLSNLDDTFIFSIALVGMLIGKGSKHPKRQVLGKTIVKREQRIKFIEELKRMNIHHSSLFPGLDGFARSLGSNLEIRLGHQTVRQKREESLLHKKLRRLVKK